MATDNIDTKRIIHSLRILSRTADKAMCTALQAANVPVEMSHLGIFHCLACCGQKEFHEIAAETHMAKSSLSDALEKYEKLGLIDRYDCSGDKRRALFSLSPEAKTWLPIFDRIRQQTLDTLFSNLSPADRQLLYRLILQATPQECD